MDAPSLKCLDTINVTIERMTACIGPISFKWLPLIFATFRKIAHLQGKNTFASSNSGGTDNRRFLVLSDEMSKSSCHVEHEIKKVCGRGTNKHLGVVHKPRGQLGEGVSQMTFL